MQFVRGGVNDPTQVDIRILHQQIPGNIDRVLFRHTLVLVDGGNVRLFFDQLLVGDSGMIHIVNQGGENGGKLREWIRCNAVRVIVQILGSIRFRFVTVWLSGDIFQIGSDNARQELDN